MPDPGSLGHSVCANRRIAASVRVRVLWSLIAAVGVVMLQDAGAQQRYPTKPVRIITVTPGGPFDVVMRGMSGPLSQALAQPVIIENRIGGNFIPAAEACAKSTPDGHTICTSDAFALSLNPEIFARLPYDPFKDFAPIIHLGFLVTSLVVNASVPAQNLQELIALARAKPDAVAFATAGPASNSNLYVEYLRKAKGIAFYNVPYKSFPQALAAVIAGEVQATIFSIGGGLAQARGGKVRVLAVTSTQRSQFAPELPTLGEIGVDVSINTWNGILAPAGTPPEIIARLNAEFRKLLADRALVEKFVTAQGFELTAPAGGSPEEFAAFLRADRANFAKVAKVVGVKMD
jgi:tripartite-type tricarboxylate transporter receptor subunit TctC